MVDMGSRDIDGLGKCGHKIETVFDSVKKLFIPGNLIYYALMLNNTPETVKMHLL